MSASINYSNLTPTLLLDFANTAQLDPRITFSRASVGSYYDTSGILQIAASGRPRFDFNPVTRESLGLLIEEQRTNLVTYSADTTNNNFLDNATVTANTITAPDNTLAGETLTSTITGGSNTCFVQKIAAVPADTQTYTFSVFLKAGTSPTTTLNMQLTGGTYQQSVAVVTWATNTISVGSGGTSSMQSVSNGWYRASITLTNNGGNTAAYPRIYVKDQGTANVSGQTVYVWGWQLEAGAFPTSHIPTVASQVIRAADAASMTGTNFSSWFNNEEGTFYAESSIQSTGSIVGTYENPAGSIRISLISPTQAQYIIENPIATYPVGFTTPASSAAPIRVAYAYATNDFAGSQNGSTAATDTSGTVPPNQTTLYIGRIVGTSGIISGTIKKIAYYSERLTNNQLQAITR